MRSYYTDLSSPTIDEHFQRSADTGRTIMMLLAGNSQHHLEDLLSRVTRAKASAFGGVFSHLIVGRALRTEGVIIADFLSTHPPAQLHPTTGKDGHVSVDHLPPREAIRPNTTLVTFVDASCPLPDAYPLALYERYGDSVHYIGGGAGLLTSNGAKGPWAFTSTETLSTEVAVVGFYESPSSIAYRHGWRRVYGPLLATNVENGTLKQLNWQNALTVYSNIVEGVLDRKVTAEEWVLPDTVGFPFGIAKQGEEDLVRLPIAINDEGELLCVGGIHNNCSLYVLHADSDDLVTAARSAANRAADAPFPRAATKLVFDCISRHIYLGERFDQELNAVSDALDSLGNNPVMGALTEGEIASHGASYMDMLNKTIAIGVFSE